MTTTLIPVFTGKLQDQPVQLCNARDLHTFLKVGKDFSTWIKDRIETYGFIDGEDFKLDSPKLANQEVCSPNSGSKRRGGHNRTDYHLTLDTAKELAMVENNEQGRMARRYFIAKEKELAQIGQTQPATEPAALPNPNHITAAQAEEMATLMCALFPNSLDRHSAWRRFNAKFKIHSYKRLPASKFTEALAFIESTDARRRNEFGREGGQGSSPLAPRNIGPQMDLDALSRQVAERLMAGQGGDRANLAEIETLLSKTMEEFNSLPNNRIYQNLHGVMRLIKNSIHSSGARRLPAPHQELTPQHDLVQLMRELDLPCVEIGLCEIEAAAECEAEQIRLGDLAAATAKALRKRPEHLADIQLVSGWMFAEAHCTEAGRDGVRQHWLGVAQSVENELSS